MSIMQTGLRWLWISLLVVGLDLGSKFYIIANVAFGWQNRIEVLPFFNIVHVHNYGAAFSFLSNAGGMQRWFFAGIAIFITLLLVYFMYKAKRSERLLNVSYALVIGGALGNLFDRLYHGYVIDFLDFYISNYHWPAFNVADMAICCGAGLLFLEAMLNDGIKKKKTK